MFNEGQFEAYRRLGVKMMEEALTTVVSATNGDVTYLHLHSSLKVSWEKQQAPNNLL
jgi:hypothetical protein